MCVCAHRRRSYISTQCLKRPSSWKEWGASSSRCVTCWRTSQGGGSSGSSIHSSYYFFKMSQHFKQKDGKETESYFITKVWLTSSLHFLPVLVFFSLSSSLLLGKHLVHVGYWKESNNLLVIGLPAERYTHTRATHWLLRCQMVAQQHFFIWATARASRDTVKRSSSIIPEITSAPYGKRSKCRFSWYHLMCFWSQSAVLQLRSTWLTLHSF